MEIFLLLLDELDDAAAMLRALLPRLLGLGVAMGLFTLTVMAVMRWPMAVILAILVCLLVTMQWLRPQLRLNTDT